MPTILPHPATACREFLGMDRGYCPEPTVITDPSDGRGFCRRHAGERGLA